MAQSEVDVNERLACRGCNGNFGIKCLTRLRRFGKFNEQGALFLERENYSYSKAADLLSLLAVCDQRRFVLFVISLRSLRGCG